MCIPFPAVTTAAGNWSPHLPPAREASTKLLSVQVLRALAALAIVVYHAQYDAQTLADRFGVAYHDRSLLPWTAGVDVFFVISGFIMVYTSRELFATADGSRIFLARRISRIVPLYWILTTAYLLIGQFAPSVLNRDAPAVGEVVKSYLFIPFAQPNGVAHPILALGWTLNYEMFFYVIFAVALPLTRLRSVMVVAAALFGFVALGRLATNLPVPLTFWSDPIVLEFVFGMGLALVAEEGHSLHRSWRVGLIAIALVLLHLDFTRPDGALVLPQVLAHGAPATMLVAAAVLGNRWPAPPALERGLGTLGDASYALYLVHPFAIRAVREFFAQAGLVTVAGLGVFLAFAIVAAVILALLVYHFIELPATRVVRGCFSVRPAGQPQA
jgi:exopolysaccharide production protein ExoZ